jgi:hypothetical protein
MIYKQPTKRTAYVYDVFYSLHSHQQVLSGIAAIFLVILLKGNKDTNVVSCVAVTP